MTKMRTSNARPLSIRIWPAVAVVACGMTLGVAGALADVSTAPFSTKTPVVRRLEPQEVQTRAMQADIFTTKKQAEMVRTSALFGESDEEKAARLAHEQNQDTQIQQLTQHVSDLDNSIQRMTGQMEQLENKLNNANAHIDRMQKDFDYRICTMSAQQLGTTVDQLPCGGGGGGAQQQQSSAAPDYNAPPPNAANAPAHLAPPPGVLGQIPSNTAMPIPPPANTDGPAPTMGASPNRAQFDAAMNMMTKGQYDEARAAFRGFVDANPKDDLAPQALYWVGSIAYLQKDFSGSARAFAEEIKKYGNSPRAPDSMLKLGQSLVAMNQKTQGCTAFEALSAKYPQASPKVLGEAKAARKTAGCK